MLTLAYIQKRTEKNIRLPGEPNAPTAPNGPAPDLLITIAQSIPHRNTRRICYYLFIGLLKDEQQGAPGRA